MSSSSIESLGPAPIPGYSLTQKVGIYLFSICLALAIGVCFGMGRSTPALTSFLVFGGSILGALIFIVSTYNGTPKGIKNNWTTFLSATSKGTIGWILAIMMTTFYVLLYWYADTLKNFYLILDPFSNFLRGRGADQWFLYGTLYTMAVLVMGVRAIYRYRHNRYQIIRTFSVMFFQLFFAYLIPAFLLAMQQPEYYFSYFWPLKPDYLFPGYLGYLKEQPGALAQFMVFWGFISALVMVPLLSYFYGKRWYCSWVCGCGGLAETLGDPFRQLSSKKLHAWKIERWMIHAVLGIIILTTALLWLNTAYGGHYLGSLSNGFNRWYGFFIGAMFSGVIGVGFYPIMGSRVWCRFGCPQAAILGLFQKFKSRFRITTNGGQCISCGNCSKYCEMGIDVRWYAQRGQNIVRASCVGCGVCSAVCPRGVLNLESGPDTKRTPDMMKLTDKKKSGALPSA